MPPGLQWDLGADGSAPPLTVIPLANRTGLTLSGEADISSRGDVRSAVASLPVQAGEIHFELGGLRFIDISTLRELLVAARRPGQPKVVLHDPPPMLQQLLDLVWGEGDTQLEVRFWAEDDSGSPVTPAAVMAADGRRRTATSLRWRPRWWSACRAAWAARRSNRARRGRGRSA
jgi:STAS domain